MENQPINISTSSGLSGKKAMMPIGDLLNKCFAIYKDKGLVMGALTIISALVYSIAFAILIPVWLSTAFGHFALLSILFAVLISLVVLLIAITASLVAQLSLFYSLKEAGIQLSVQSIKKLMTTSWNNLGPFFWIALLQGLIVLFGFILLIIPGIIFCVWFCFSSMAFVFENIKGYVALKRSKELVKGYWWPVLGRLLLMILTIMLVGMIPGVGNVIVFLILTPLALIYMYIMYEDLKSLRS